MKLFILSHSETDLTDILSILVEKVWINIFFINLCWDTAHFQEAPKAVSNIGDMTGVEDEGDINLKIIFSNSTAEKETKDISDCESCSISGEEKSKRTRTIFNYEGDENLNEKVQGSSSNWCFMISTSLMVITIICFITGSYLAVRTKTNTDIISQTGH